jgi:uncharacterized protein
MADFVTSRFNILVPLRGGRTLAYNGSSAATAIWDIAESEIYDRVDRGEDVDPAHETVGDLVRCGFIVPHDTDEVDLLRQQYETFRNDPRQMVLTIAPTLACNFGCDYCFQGQDKPHGIMSQRVQDAILEMASQASRSIKRLHVAWYGGEPLLALPVIESLSDHLISLCNRSSVAYDAMIVTNGYKLTPQVARSLYSRQVKSAQVTIDGAAGYHDQRRSLLGGQPTFARICENLKAVLDEVPLRLSVRINIDVRNFKSIRRVLEHFVSLGLARRKMFGVYFAPVEAITEGCHCVADVCMSKGDYGSLEAELTRYAYDLGLAALPYPPRFRGVCGAVRPKGIVVIPNGDLHKCWDTVHMGEHKVGSVFDLDAARVDERANEWRQWSPFENKICTSCKILPNCAGSCAHKFINSDQTRGEAASLPCPSWKYNIMERLILMAERSGAITAQDYDPEEIKTDPRKLCAASEAIDFLGPEARDVFRIASHETGQLVQIGVSQQPSSPQAWNRLDELLPARCTA